MGNVLLGPEAILRAAGGRAPDMEWTVLASGAEGVKGDFSDGGTRFPTGDLTPAVTVTVAPRK